MAVEHRTRLTVRIATKNTAWLNRTGRMTVRAWLCGFFVFIAMGKAENARSRFLYQKVRLERYKKLTDFDGHGLF